VAFHEKHPSVSVAVSKFAKLLLEHCILAGARGIHTVCVCVIYQNIAFMGQAAHITANSVQKIFLKNEGKKRPRIPLNIYDLCCVKNLLMV
jgi:hypothetical protein